MTPTRHRLLPRVLGVVLLLGGLVAPLVISADPAAAAPARAGTRTLMRASSPSSVRGETVVYHVTVTSTGVAPAANPGPRIPTGPVELLRVRENGRLRLVGQGTLTAGAVDISVAETVKGTDKIAAHYLGSSRDLPSSRTMTQTMTDAPAMPLARPVPKILSASWGTDNAVGCPSGQQGLDNIPVTFNWFIRGPSIQTTDFEVVRSDGTTATPTCALQFPPDESDEAQTVNLIGNFGDAVNGPTPVGIRVVGALQGTPPGGFRWSQIASLPEAEVEPISGGPYIVDAWTLMPAIYHGDANRCTVGATFVRVMWSNGLTAYPTGAEVGAPVVASYRARYRLTDGRVISLAPLDVADLHDHSTAANADNMHDLCLPRVPAGAQLEGVTIGADLIQDPNGDPNLAQHF